MSDSPTKLEIAWRQYAVLVDLQKNYFDLVIKFNAYYYAATSGIVAFFFLKPELGHSMGRLLLLLPVAMGVLFAALGILAGRAISPLHVEAIRVAQLLDLKVSPDPRAAALALYASTIMLVLVAAGILVLLLLSTSGRL